MYKWIRPGPPIVPIAFLRKIARSIGFLPLLLYGVWGTTLTFPVPVHVVIGKPIELPQIADPSPAQIDMHLQQFIQSMSSIFEEYKHKTGHVQKQLEIF